MVAEKSNPTDTPHKAVFEEVEVDFIGVDVGDDPGEATQHDGHVTQNLLPRVAHSNDII